MANHDSAGGALFELPEEPAGRHERMLLDALDAARESGRIERVDGGLVSLAIANAAALDRALRMKNAPYAISGLTGPYREVLSSLRMTPDDRDSEADDELARALRDLDRATVVDGSTRPD